MPTVSGGRPNDRDVLTIQTCPLKVTRALVAPMMGTISPSAYLIANM
jgi:hypothetical protein